MVRPLVRFDIWDALGDVFQTHYMPAAVVDNKPNHYGHELHHSCSCRPRSERVEGVLTFHHKGDQ